VSETPQNRSWLRKNERPSRFLAVAVATMALIGFALVGALSVVHAIDSSAAPMKIPLATPLKGPGIVALEQKVTQMLHPGYGSIQAKPTKTTSGNWAGYALTATAGTILESFGGWNVPTISCGTLGVYGVGINDNWVGIDGFNNGEVEQGGTLGYCSGVGATPVYYTWWEFYPYNSVQFYGSTVSAGDLIDAYVLYDPTVSTYTITIEDLSNSANSFFVYGNPSSGPDASAECISESLVGEGYDLPNYGTTTFDICNAEVNGYYNGIGGLPHGAGATVYSITQYGPVSGKKEQTVGSLHSAFGWKDTLFTITWHKYD
jgi:hypothetical protein